MSLTKYGMVLALSLTLNTASASSGKAPSNHSTRSQAVLRARRNPCDLVGTILGPKNDGSKSCPKLRQDNGDLIVSVHVADDRGRIRLLQNGQRCPGGIVAIALRPGKRARSVGYLEITLDEMDERTLRFEGYSAFAEILPNGRVGSGTSGCGPDVEGRIRLTKDGWHLVGERSAGCED